LFLLLLQGLLERALLNMQLLSPFLIAGDFNCHHFLWNTAIQTHSQEAATLVQWLQKHSAQLLNAGQTQTFYRSNLRAKSIIDLAFTAGFKENTWDNWHRAEDTGSDHIAIRYSTFTKQTKRLQNPLQAATYALQKADWELFGIALQEQFKRRQIS